MIHNKTLHCVAKAFKLESDFETSIFCCGFVKILVNLGEDNLSSRFVLCELFGGTKAPPYNSRP